MLHVYSRLMFIMPQCLSCIFVPCHMQIFTWMAVITEHRSSRREAWGVWFIARYLEGNERHTLVTIINDGRPSSNQLQRNLSAPSCTCSKPNRKGLATGEELCALVFWGIPLISPVLFQSYQHLLTLKCSLNSEWRAICFRSFWYVEVALLFCQTCFVPLLQGRMAWMSPQWLNARILILAWENDCNPISCYYILLNRSYFWNWKHLSSFLPLWAQVSSMD